MQGVQELFDTCLQINTSIKVCAVMHNWDGMPTDSWFLLNSSKKNLKQIIHHFKAYTEGF